MKDLGLVHFFGPDGAGKTTQVELLVKYLRKRGVKTRKCWVRSPHTLAYLLWKLFAKIGFYRTIWNPFGIGIKIPAVDRSVLLKKFWSFVEFLSVKPHIVRVNRLLSKGYVIVAERYLLDTITTVAFFIDDLGFLRSSLAKVLIRLLPKNSALVFVDADFQSILNRRRPLFHERMRDLANPSKKRVKVRVYGYVPNSVVEPQEFIDFQRKAYETLANSLGAFKVFSPDFSIREISGRILEFLDQRQ